MTLMHPHWRATNEDREIPANPAPAPHRIAIGRPLWMRRIAAVIGCLIVFGVGMMLAQQSGNFSSQTFDANPYNDDVLLEDLTSQSDSIAVQENIVREVKVTITPNGPMPARAVVHPGDTIVWVNEQDIPHILESDKLLDASGSLLYTPALFSGELYRFTLADDHALGEFSYQSTTSENVAGAVSVEEFVEVIPVSSSSSISSEMPIISSSSSTFSSSSFSSEFPPVFGEAQSSSSSTFEAIIPVNPYTVDGTREHPFDSEGNPLDQNGTTRPPATQHRPLQNTETGPALWTTVMISLAAFGMITQRAFRSMRQQ